jgi:hypothetical protein
MAPSTKSSWISWRLLNNFLFYRVGLLAPRPTPSRRTRPLYLYPTEAGWLPILVASYDMHRLRWGYSYSPVTTRGFCLIIGLLKIYVCTFSLQCSIKWLKLLDHYAFFARRSWNECIMGRSYPSVCFVSEATEPILIKFSIGNLR